MVNSKRATSLDSEVKGEYADMILGKDFTPGWKVKIESGNNISLCKSVQRTRKADIDSGHLDDPSLEIKGRHTLVAE